VSRTQALLDWYARGRRDLPWRRTRDPYALLVSEVMLQQTQAARVVPRYAAWLEEFPDERALATAPVAAVLRAWSGLGYNRRALALWRAARELVAHGWPRDAAGLRALPGVGPYTAAAVASFAWDEDVAALDVNARRVIERWEGGALTPGALARRAAEWLPAGRAAEFNQAMMELGATVCTARRARCELCPLSAGCVTRRRGGPRDPPPGRREPRARFEDTDRWARGRVMAALARGERLPDMASERLERALAGLERDGLVVRDRRAVRLP
jgi:A/G-specific adenine glycosylase